MDSTDALSRSRSLAVTSGGLTSGVTYSKFRLALHCRVLPPNVMILQPLPSILNALQ